MSLDRFAKLKEDNPVFTLQDTFNSALELERAGEVINAFASDHLLEVLEPMKV